MAQMLKPNFLQYINWFHEFHGSFFKKQLDFMRKPWENPWENPLKILPHRSLGPPSIIGHLTFGCEFTGEAVPAPWDTRHLKAAPAPWLSMAFLMGFP